MVEDAEEKKVSGKNKKLGKKVGHRLNPLPECPLLYHHRLKQVQVCKSQTRRISGVKGKIVEEEKSSSERS